MNFDDDYYKQWKIKSTNNHRFFVDETNPVKDQLIESGKIFSSTAIEDHTQSETFSLRLSESYVDETQENLNSEAKQKQNNEIIMISDSSTDESIFSYERTKKLTNNKDSKFHMQRKINIIESSDDESSKTPVRYFTLRKDDESNNPVFSKEGKNEKVIIEESDSEFEPSKVPDLIKETVVESVNLSDRKKREILQWLSKNIDGSRCGSSCSQDSSAIADSRKSGISSGNSSLERLELNFETPNNRGKLSKLSTTGKSRSNYKNDEHQSRLDQYFTKTKKNQLDIVKDKTPGSKHSDKTPMNSVKITSRRRLLTESESFDSKTPCSINSDKIKENNIRSNSRRVIMPESKAIDSKTPSGQNSDRTLGNKIRSDLRKNIVLDSDSLDSSTSGNSNFDKNPTNLKNNTKTDSKKIIQTESSDSEVSESKISEDIPGSSERVIIPETQSPNSTDHTNSLDQSPIEQSMLRKMMSTNKIMLNEESPSLITLDESDLKNDKVQENCEVQNKNTTINTTINDCADILENLYGATWRNKVNSLVTASEPRKQTTKKILKEVQTEKKSTFRQSQLNIELDENCIFDKENNINNPKKVSQTTSKKSKFRSKQKDTYINDGSTTESSPDCSYYTALTNPTPSQKNRLKTQTASTIKASDKNKLEKVYEICDSESDSETDNWKNRGVNRRKLSFDSSTSSSTSEFDPEDIVPPKSASKVTKKIVNTEPKKINQQAPKKSFLASLSKDVPLNDADFKAMTYRVKYSSMKEELCKVLYKLYNEKVFENKLPNDMSIEWSARLRGTAGKCYNKQSLKALGNTVRSSRIILATKILDSPDRLRDTLIHEMCHAATWLINSVSDGHGSFWKAWANKAMKVFPELPPISRCHNYEIQTKYTYKCVSCGYSVGRHSKSLDLNTKRCGYCHGKFELLINKVTKNGKVQTKINAEAKPSGFALFVKENYHTVKQSRAAIKHGEVMKILGQQFSAVKLTPRPEDRARNNEEESP